MFKSAYRVSDEPHLCMHHKVGNDLSGAGEYSSSSPLETQCCF